MRAVTIDKFDIKAHERYAQDQLFLDPTFLKESSLIPPHSEITGVSTIYSSKWEELFELQIRNLSWAFFCSPPLYHMHAKRFFSYRLIPSINLSDEGNEKDEQQEGEDNRDEFSQEHQKLIDKILNAGCEIKKSTHTEKERSILLNLVDSIRYLDKMLKTVNARKLQYQKG